MASITSVSSNTHSPQHTIEILGVVNNLPYELELNGFDDPSKIRGANGFVKLSVTSLEQDFVRAVWNGHLETINTYLEADSSLLRRVFKVKMVSQFCMKSQENPVMMLGSVMHIACFTINPTVLNLLFSHSEYILLNTSANFYQRLSHSTENQLENQSVANIPLFTLVKYIDDRVGYHFVFNVLKKLQSTLNSLDKEATIFPLQFDLVQSLEQTSITSTSLTEFSSPNADLTRPSTIFSRYYKHINGRHIKTLEVIVLQHTIAKTIVFGKHLMLESCLKFLSSEGTNLLSRLLIDAHSFPADVANLVIDYSSYISSPKTREILNTKIEENHTDSILSSDLTLYPLGKTLNILRSEYSSSEIKHQMILIAAMLLKAGADLYLKYDENTSIYMEFAKDFPPFFLENLLTQQDDQVTSSVERLAKFQETRRKEEEDKHRFNKTREPHPSTFEITYAVDQTHNVIPPDLRNNITTDECCSIL